MLDAVEWLALGFEIIDCVFPDWKFQPADFVASFGLHAALVVGEPRTVDARRRFRRSSTQLPRFKLRLTKNGELVEEGSGKELAAQPGALPGGARRGNRASAWRRAARAPASSSAQAR